MARIAVVGSLNVDLCVRTPRVPLTGENLRAEQFMIGPGGKGANSAVALVRAGAEALLVGCVGEDDFGRRELDELRAAGVDVGAVVTLPDVATGVALVLLDATNENTILVIEGANSRLTGERVRRALAPERALDGILVNFEIPEEAVAAAVQVGRQRGIPVVVDAGPPRPYPPTIWGGCTVLTPNALEAEQLTGQSVTDEASARRAAESLLAAGPAAVVVKMGAQGALLATRAGSRHFPPLPASSVDTTGAGDAFSATLAIALAEALSLEEAVWRASAAGALATTRSGALAAMPWRQEIDTLLAGTVGVE